LRNNTETNTKGRKNPPIKKFFSSLKLTTWLLLILAFSSILGTIIPQQGVSTTIHTHLSEELLRLFNFFQLFDVYHSYWFLFLCGLLCLNIVVCVTGRIPSAIRYMKKNPIQTMPSDSSFVDVNVAEEDLDKTLLRLEHILRYRFGKVRRVESDQGITLFAQRGRYKRGLLLVAHLSVLVIIFGMAVGRYTGFEAYVEIPEGEIAEAVYLNNNPGIIDLGFSIRCDAFHIDLYDTGMPKEYSSELSFMKDGHIVQKGVLRVNHPLSFKGIRFYQASYSKNYRAQLNITRNEEVQSVNALFENTYQLGDQDTKFTVVRVEQNFMNMGPAVELDISDSSRHIRIWIFKHIDEMISAVPDLLERVPKFNPGRFQPYVFSLEGLNEYYKTGLMVNRDPGGIIVALGGLFFFLGIFISLLTPRKRVWARIQGGTIGITIQGGRQSSAADKDINRIIREIRRNRT
jgi:cytochrome c biogenesis protein